MSDNVHMMPNADVDPELILEKAKKWRLKDVLVVGWDENDDFIVGGSMVSLKEITWLLRATNNWVNNRMQDVE